MSNKIRKDTYKNAYALMCTARAMTHIFEENKEVTSKYVHATSAGHEAIQLAARNNVNLITRNEIMNWRPY